MSQQRVNELYDQLYGKIGKLAQVSSRANLSTAEGREERARLTKQLPEIHDRLDEAKAALEAQAPFYSSDKTGSPYGTFNSLADFGRKLWYNREEPDALETAAKGVSNYIRDTNKTASILAKRTLPPAFLVPLTARVGIESTEAVGREHYGKNRNLLDNYIKTPSKRAFNTEGYIIDQIPMEDVDYSKGNTGANGCGWIAAYNCEKMLDPENTPHPADVLRAMEPGALMSAQFGTDPFYIADYFEDKGYDVEFNFTKKGVEQAAENADANIWVTVYAVDDNLGAHFVACQNNYDGTFHFYNGGELGAPKKEVLLNDTNAELSQLYYHNDLLRFMISISRK